MSSAPSGPSASSLPPPVPPAGRPPRREITLISHSMLFYWWPIWLLGFILATWTWMDNSRLAIVPDKSRLEFHKDDQLGSDADSTVYRLAVKNPSTKSLENAKKVSDTPGSEEQVFKPRISER